MNDPAWYQPFLDAVGWVPAVVFPAASVLQLMTLLRRGKADGVSVLTWTLFAVANVCLYLTVAEWTRPQVIATTLGTALVQVVVVMTALRLRTDKAAPRQDSPPEA